jgi:hypothetical protein
VAGGIRGVLVRCFARVLSEEDIYSVHSLDSLAQIGTAMLECPKTFPSVVFQILPIRQGSMVKSIYIKVLRGATIRHALGTAEHPAPSIRRICALVLF